MSENLTRNAAPIDPRKFHINSTAYRHLRHGRGIVEQLLLATSQRQYCSYLLRLWRVGPAEATVWRVSLEDTLTGTRRIFSDLPSLLIFLETCMDDDLSGDETVPTDKADSG